MRFDVDTGEFSCRYRPDLQVKAPTEIFVSPLHYSNGWTVAVDGGRSVGRTPTRLLVHADGYQPVAVRIVTR